MISLGTTEKPLRAARLRHSTIDATSAEGDGGAIAIHANAFLVSSDSSLDVTGATGDGTVTIDSSRPPPLGELLQLSGPR